QEAQAALAEREGAASGGGTPDAGGGEDAPAGSIVTALTEWDVVPDPGQTAAGNVTFAAQNDGSLPHELAVVSTDLPDDQLPQAGGTVDEGQVEVVGRTSTFGAGASETLAVDLAPGDYVLICNVVGHYQQGMHSSFTVE
ncbi:MAG: sulfocyanin-like copper-binding protein, partial [Dehalococcoidia bacterium]